MLGAPLPLPAGRGSRQALGVAGSRARAGPPTEGPSSPLAPPQCGPRPPARDRIRAAEARSRRPSTQPARRGGRGEPPGLGFPGRPAPRRRAG